MLLPVLLPPPTGLPADGWRVSGVGLAMALWWMTEAAPLPATALVPLAVFAPAGIAPFAEVASTYAHPLIVLFLGGFLVARALEHHGLHRRLAEPVLRLGAGRPAATVGALMVATAFLSIWISNTASTMIMAPIGAAIVAERPEDWRLGAATMLGIAYAATIGGMGSLIGTPPNALFAVYMADNHGVTIGFTEWAAIGLPIVVLLLPLTWLLLTKVMFIPRGERMGEFGGITGSLSVAGRRAVWIIVLTAGTLVLRPAFDDGGGGITDAGILVSGALALFLCPDGGGGRLLDWEIAKGLRWDVLILFGGGLALARAIDTSGLAAWLAGQAGALYGLPALLIVAALAGVIVLVGELASNTAMAAVFLPIAGATSIGLGIDPLHFALPVALAASVGFMLPVATPPNAIVFAHEAVTRSRMLRAGLPLDLLATVVAIGIAFLLAPLIFGHSGP